MADLSGGGGVIEATITIKRKATGKEEVYQLVLTPEKAEEQAISPQKEERVSDEEN